MDQYDVFNDLMGVLAYCIKDAEIDMGLKITDFDDANDLGIDNPNPSIIVSDSKGNQCQIIIKKLEE